MLLVRTFLTFPVPCSAYYLRTYITVKRCFYFLYLKMPLYQGLSPQLQELPSIHTILTSPLAKSPYIPQIGRPSDYEGLTLPLVKLPQVQPTQGHPSLQTRDYEGRMIPSQAPSHPVGQNVISVVQSSACDRSPHAGSAVALLTASISQPRPFPNRISSDHPSTTLIDSQAGSNATKKRVNVGRYERGQKRLKTIAELEQRVRNLRKERDHYHGIAARLHEGPVPPWEGQQQGYNRQEDPEGQRKCNRCIYRNTKVCSERCWCSISGEYY